MILTWNSIKIRHYEKATKLEKIFDLFWQILEIISNFCALLRKADLYKYVVNNKICSSPSFPFLDNHRDISDSFRYSSTLNKFLQVQTNKYFQKYFIGERQILQTQHAVNFDVPIFIAIFTNYFWTLNSFMSYIGFKVLAIRTNFLGEQVFHTFYLIVEWRECQKWMKLLDNFGKRKY